MSYKSNHLRLVRLQKGYTLKTLAEATGIPFQRISRIEQGLEPMKLEYQIKLENILEIDFFNNNETDREILGLFDDFLEIIFLGNFNLSGIILRLEKINNCVEKTKYMYLVSVMEYVLHHITQPIENVVFEKKDLKHIDFDNKASCLYLTYMGVREYELKHYDIAIKYLSKVIKEVEDEKIKALAQYQLCYVFIHQYKLLQALECIEKAKIIFYKYGAYIRVYECDVHLGNILSFMHKYSNAIETYFRCIKTAEMFDFPKTEIALLYRNIALNHIYNKSYEEAIMALNKASKADTTNELLIMYYIYSYCYLGEYNKAKTWLNRARRFISNKSLLIELSYWKAVIKNQDAIPKQTIINKAVHVYEYYIKQKNYEAVFLYLEIIVQLYEKIGNIEKAYFYMKKEKELQILIQNS